MKVSRLPLRPIIVRSAKERRALARLRKSMEKSVERLLAVLDELDGDPEAEITEEDDEDGGDDEPEEEDANLLDFEDPARGTALARRQLGKRTGARHRRFRG